jgi:hypothetical protein
MESDAQLGRAFSTLKGVMEGRQVDEQRSRRNAAGIMSFKNAPIDPFGEPEVIRVDDEASAAIHEDKGVGEGVGALP